VLAVYQLQEAVDNDMSEQQQMLLNRKIENKIIESLKLVCKVGIEQ